VAKKSGEIGNALESYGLAYSNDAHRFYASMDTDPSHNGIAVLSNVVTPGEWHELALVYSSNGANSSLSLYVDHVLQNSTTGNFAPNYANFPLLIGAGNYLGDPSGAFRRNFDGLIDEVRISDEALTPSQLLPAVPEPASIGAFAIGTAGLLLGRRRRG
jgi:hypothetical protein